jgi:hypothetical protein
VILRGVAGLLVLLLAGCTVGVDRAGGGPTATPGAAASRPVATTPPSGPVSFATLAARAEDTLEQTFYAGDGRWWMCVPGACGPTDMDWGADSLTDALWFRWSLSPDTAEPAIINSVLSRAFDWPKGTINWSDVPMWDAVADLRDYQVTHRPSALAKAVAAFRLLTVDDTNHFAGGACPGVDYQQPGGATGLKTLETDSNFLKAALLLYETTRNSSYLTLARSKYAAVRRYFLDPTVPLYTTYLFDDGRTCTPLPSRFFASVNGNMIWAGVRLAQDTSTAAYLADAVATGQAVRRHLSDAAGGFAALQAENDVGEPLTEGMYELATRGGQEFAHDWLLTNADAAASAVNADGAYARNGEGPAPAGQITAWQTAGGMTLEFAAASLDPDGGPTGTGYWARARFVPADLSLDGGPVTVTFTGRAVAIIGAIGDVCCESGHARVFVDGIETFDQTGIWQNKSSTGRTLADSVLFAWRWPDSGTHTVRVEPGIPNPKEGDSYFHMTGYQVVA